MDYIAAFIRYLGQVKRYSSKTLKAYQTDLDQYFLFLSQKDQKATFNVHHREIRQWIVNLMDAQFSPRSVNRKISTLNTFYEYLLRENVVSANPMKKITAPKTSKPLPHFVDEKSTDRLFGSGLFSNDFSGQRDRLVMELLYMTGIRVSELIGLKYSDIDNHNLTIKVLGKRNKERIIPIVPDFLDRISKYRQLCTSHFNTPCPAELILTDKGQTAYPRFIYRITTHYLPLVTTLEKRNPHLMRHTFATHLLNAGAELNAVKELLGHANLSATEIYTHNTFEKLKTIYNHTHPRA